MTDKLTMLARAEKDGKPVHEGLRKASKKWVKCGLPETGCDLHVPLNGQPTTYQHQVSSFIPNPDLGALIAACQVQYWEVDFLPKYVRVSAPNHVSEYYSTVGDNQTALIDAVWQATKTLEPDNWVECAVHNIDDGKPVCGACDGLGIVTKEEAWK